MLRGASQNSVSAFGDQVRVLVGTKGTAGISPSTTPCKMLKHPMQPLNNMELSGTQEATGKAGEDKEARGFGSTDSALFQKPRAVTQESSIADETTELFRQQASQHLLANHD